MYTHACSADAEYQICTFAHNGVHSRHAWIPGLASRYSSTAVDLHVRKILVRHLTLMKDYTAVDVVLTYN